MYCFSPFTSKQLFGAVYTLSPNHINGRLLTYLTMDVIKLCLTLSSCEIFFQWLMPPRLWTPNLLSERFLPHLSPSPTRCNTLLFSSHVFLTANTTVQTTSLSFLSPAKCCCTSDPFDVRSSCLLIHAAFTAGIKWCMCVFDCSIVWIYVCMSASDLYI